MSKKLLKYINKFLFLLNKARSRFALRGRIIYTGTRNIDIFINAHTRETRARAIFLYLSIRAMKKPLSYSKIYTKIALKEDWV